MVTKRTRCQIANSQIISQERKKEESFAPIHFIHERMPIKRGIKELEK